MEEDLHYRRYREELEQRWNNEYRRWRRAQEIDRIARARGGTQREGALQSLGEAIVDVVAAPASPLAEQAPGGAPAAVSGWHTPPHWR